MAIAQPFLKGVIHLQLDFLVRQLRQERELTLCDLHGPSPQDAVGVGTKSTESVEA